MQEPTSPPEPPLGTPPGNAFRRRRFLSAGLVAGAGAVGGAIQNAGAQEAPEREGEAGAPVVQPPARRLLLSVKLGMIADELDGRKLGLAERLALAGDAGFDGVDFDEAGSFTAEEARAAVRESGVFVHNAINHDHWKMRLTSPDPEVRRRGRENIAHCLRVSHAAGGSGVLIVVGRGSDGDAGEIEERCREEIRSLLPLAASLGQPILFENVWNQMFYDHDGPPEQSADRHVAFIDSFDSPWVGQYFDIGNHWKYGQPGDWIRALGRRCVKLDVKGFDRAADKFTDIGAGDLPWDDVRAALDEIGFSGWATAEVGGGGLDRLRQVREQMEEVFGLA